MIELNGTKIALLAAAVARVANSEHHTFQYDPALDEIAKELGAIQYNVYDSGPRDQKNRYIRFDFAADEIEVMVGPKPELIRPTQPTPDDDGTPGSPIAMAA